MYLNQSVTYDYEPYHAIFLAYFLLGEQKKVRRGAGRSARGSEPTCQL
jgi:hypothetical protein